MVFLMIWKEGIIISNKRGLIETWHNRRSNDCSVLEWVREEEKRRKIIIIRNRK